MTNPNTQYNHESHLPTPHLELVTERGEPSTQKEHRPYEVSAAYYDDVYRDKPYEREAAALKEVIGSRLHTGGNDLLEVACGTGKYFEPFSDRFRIEGLDLSPEQLDVARQKFPDTPLYEADMTDFTLSKEYDVVMCLFSSIGCAQTVEKLRSTVDSMSRALKPGGQILIEPWVFEGELKGTPSMITIDQPDVKLSRITTVTQEDRLSHLEMSYMIWRPGTGVEMHTEQVTMGLFSVEDYTEALRDAGIDNIEFHRDGLSDNEGQLFKRGLFVGTKSTMPTSDHE